MVDDKGVKIDLGGTRAIAQAATPRHQEEVRSFLGLVNHYRKYVDNMSTRCLRALNRLLEKEVRWKWSVKCQAVFQEIRDMLTRESDDNLVVHFDPKPGVSSCLYNRKRNLPRLIMLTISDTALALI